MIDLQTIGTIDAGDPASIAYAIQAADGTALDVVGGSARWTLRNWLGRPPYGEIGAEILAKTTPGGITLGSGGVVTVVLNAGDVPGATMGTFYAELEVTLASGVVRTVKRLVEISPSVLN